MKTELIIDPEFESKIPPLTEEEFRQLEENILSNSEIINPLIVWNGILVDGHNRYRIIKKHPENLYRVYQMHFSDRYEAILPGYARISLAAEIRPQNKSVISSASSTKRKRCDKAQIISMFRRKVKVLTVITFTPVGSRSVSLRKII